MGWQLAERIDDFFRQAGERPKLSPGTTSLVAVLLKNKRMLAVSSILLFSALGATRTRDPLLRKQVLYPLSYESQGKLLAFRNCEEWLAKQARRSNLHSSLEVAARN